MSDIYARIWLGVRNCYWLFVRKVFAHCKLLSGKFWLLCLCIGVTSDLIFVTKITNYIRGEKIVIVKNFSFPCMTIFISIYAVLSLNLLFTLFCLEIFTTIYAISYLGELSPKVYLWRKDDKYQVYTT